MELLAQGKVNRPEWFKGSTTDPVEYVCGICEKTKRDKIYFQLGICKDCERVIRAFVPSAAEKTVAQISEEDLKKIKYLFKRGVSSKRVTPVCRICGTKHKSFKEMSDPANLVCIDCYKSYVKTMLPQGRWALNKITLLDTEFKHLRDAYIHDKYSEEDEKKYKWFLEEYGGKLPDQEHMNSLVGFQQAERIRLLDKNRRREKHVAMVEERKKKKTKVKLFFPEVVVGDSELTIKAKELLKKVLGDPYQILPSEEKLLEITGETQEVIDELLRVDKPRRRRQFWAMPPEKRILYIEIRHPADLESYKERCAQQNAIKEQKQKHNTPQTYGV